MNTVITALGLYLQVCATAMKYFLIGQNLSNT